MFDKVMGAGWEERRLIRWLYLALAGIPILIFGKVITYGFVSYDDGYYITSNPHVWEGLTLENIVWAFTNTSYGHWFPLTWLTHALVCQIGYPNPSLSHALNVVLHAANTVLVFHVLRMMTRAKWRCFFAAVLFSVHPLNVESVAWITELSNVLCAFFCLWMIWAYVRYVRNPSAGRYCAVFCFFLLGILAKPLIMSFPFVLLLLDYWPLNRMAAKGGAARNFGKLFVEKIPLMFVSAADGVLSVVANTRSTCMPFFEGLPLAVRISNAIVSYVKYLGKIFWPVDMTCFYVHFGLWLTPEKILGASLILIVISIFVWEGARRCPYGIVGWLWYMGTLFPMSGLFHAGAHAMADRYMYVPMLGIFLAVVWGTADVWTRWRLPKSLGWMCAVFLVGVLSFTSFVQAGYWRDSATLFEHGIKVDPNNWVAHHNLGVEMVKQGDLQKAIRHFSMTLQINPCARETLSNMGDLMMCQKKYARAVEYYRRAESLVPQDGETAKKLGFALMGAGDLRAAAAQWNRAMALNPDDFNGHLYQGLVLARQGKSAEAVVALRTAARLQPAYASAINSVVTVLEKERQ